MEEVGKGEVLDRVIVGIGFMSNIESSSHYSKQKDDLKSITKIHVQLDLSL